ncbi:DUF4185 domain-containing protein [Lentisalinibacter salinarum]|uniref:DUF4185 domain-containing protein n=1 Tax=Lentisalinibacter salinarum TaxID=2992239 RepID=UPI00387064C7
MDTFTFGPVTRYSTLFCLFFFGISSALSNPKQEVPDIRVTLRMPEPSIVPRPPEHAGRDVGFSGLLRGRSVWVFGDTFLPGKGDDGLGWRSSSWSWTTDLSSDDGIGEFIHALGDDGMALQLLPHTPAEYSYNIAHEGHEDCVAKSQCGSRRTPWPQALVTDPSGDRAVLYYLNMQTGPGGAWDFRSVSGSLATWDNPDAPATRIEPPLFSNEEPDWGAAAVLVDEDIFVYACEFDGTRKPCLLARVPFVEATNRESYRFWAGDGSWSMDWREAVPIFDGGSLFSVHFSDYLGQYVAFYTPGLGEPFKMRTSDSPQGPWSGPVSIGEGVPAEKSWNYALIAHAEFQREGGRVEVLSYTNPSGFLTQETRLVEVHLK